MAMGCLVERGLVGVASAKNPQALAIHSNCRRHSLGPGFRMTKNLEFYSNETRRGSFEVQQKELGGFWFAVLVHTPPSIKEIGGGRVDWKYGAAGIKKHVSTTEIDSGKVKGGENQFILQIPRLWKGKHKMFLIMEL